MEQLKNYLLSLKGDVFKLLPMKEEELKGADNHTTEYIEALIINLTGAMSTFPVLAQQKQYLYVLNNIQYMYSHRIDLRKWRRIVLNSTRSIDYLCSLYCGG